MDMVENATCGHCSGTGRRFSEDGVNGGIGVACKCGGTGKLIKTKHDRILELEALVDKLVKIMLGSLSNQLKSYLQKSESERKPGDSSPAVHVDSHEENGKEELTERPL